MDVCSNSLLDKRWTLRPYEENQVLTLMQKLNLSPTLARLLAMRGHDITSAPPFLSPSLKDHLPDPIVLKDMEKAVQRVVKAIVLQEKIVVWGDYDVDGATSSALLTRFFKAINVQNAVYIPDRMKEGYGLNSQGIQRFIKQGYSVMITVDCGTTSFDALEKTEGLDVIVLDHHASEAKLPNAYAIVNPNRLDEENSIVETFGHLAAVGISYLFIIALNRALREAWYYTSRPEPSLIDFLDLVALGTVCDVMPLTGLNRTFVSQGLKVLGKRNNLGLKALSDISGLDEKPTPYHLGFVLGPRINAGGRVGESFLGSRLLSTDSPEEACEIAKMLDAYNQERRSLEAEALEQALLLVDPEEPAIVVSHSGWHEGVIGIVAGRLKERFNKPTAVIAWNEEGLGKASARSIPGFDFGRFIHRAHHLGFVLSGGGHAMAAGFSLTKDQLPQLTQFLRTELLELYKEGNFKPQLICDGYIDLRSLTPSLIQEIDLLSPFGMGNPGPKFIFSDVMVESFQIIQEQHLKCRFSQGDGVIVEGMGFRLKDTPLWKILIDCSRRPLDLLASPKVDTWGGREKITLMIEDVAHPQVALRQTG